MVKIIQLGFFNKKILLPFGVAFAQILINVMNFTLHETSKNQILEMIGASLGEIALVLIPLFNISAFKTIKISTDEKNTRCKTILYYSILSLIYACYLCLNIFTGIQSSIYDKNNKSLQNPHNSGLSSLEGLELVFICLISIKLLKYKYFIHHIIFIIIFLILCLAIDLILENFTDIYKRGVLYIVLKIILILLDALNNSYPKYMIDVQYHPFWSIPVTIGIINLLCFSIILIIILAKGRAKSFEENNQMFIDFYKYFDEVDNNIILVKNVLNFILNFFLNFLRILTILHLRPEYILISFTISKILDIFFESKKYECIALFVLQLLTLMFYLEIFELNFCGLNKNTRRNIQEREQEEMDLNENIIINNRRSSLSSGSSNIEVSPDYIVDAIRESDDNDDSFSQ